MVYYIHDMIENYEDQEDEDIQYKISERREFYELKSSSREKQPEKGGFFKHQELFTRYARQYDRIFNIHETGTGKTGSIISLAEHYKNKQPGVVKKFIILEPGPPTVEDFKDQIVKLSKKDSYLVRNNDVEDSSYKNNLTRMINKYYEVTTYRRFIKDDLSDEKIEEYYSDCVFFFDEAHRLRNLSDNSGSEISEEEFDKILSYLWRVTHIAKRIKVIVASATPMINKVRDFQPLLNLLLPADMQFPKVKEDSFYENLTLEQLEPYIRGMVTFVRFSETNIKVSNKGVDFKDFVHSIEYNREGTSNKIVPDVKKVVNNVVVEVSSGKNKTKKDFVTKKVHSQITIYPIVMNDFQQKYYEEAEKLKKDAFLDKARQSSTFVFPDGSFGQKGFLKYVELNEYQNYSLRETYFKKGKQVQSLKSYINNDDIDQSISNLGQLSCKFQKYVKKEIEASKKERPGNSFCYIEHVEGSGVIVLSLILEQLGFENFRLNDSTIVDSKNRIRENFKKKKRFALITGKTTNLRNMLRVFNSPDNMDGEYIQMILASEVARDGINIKNVLRGYILSPGWHESGMHQALSRFVRADSHNLLRQRNMEEMKIDDESYKVKVDIYRLASVRKDEINKNFKNYEDFSVDVKTYLEAERKDIKIRRIMRFFKVCAFDAYLNYSRNFRKTDRDYSKESDYMKALPRIWKSRGAPENTKRKGIALNQGPDKEDVVFNTYNIMYVEENTYGYNMLAKYLNAETKIINIKKFLESVSEKSEFKDRYPFILPVYEVLRFSGLNFSREYKIILLGKYLVITNNLTSFKSEYVVDSENFQGFSDVSDMRKNKNFEISSGKDTDILEKELEGKSESQIIEYYSVEQNYYDFKLLLEKSLINKSQGKNSKFDDKILKLFRNYYMKTKIPTGWFEKVRDALKTPEVKKQGRKRAEGSLAGLKNLDLNEFPPKFKDPEVYIHFYRESDATGFNITSILEGKFRKIRILENGSFKDTDSVEEFVYTKLFDNYYDRILEKYKKFKFYGSYIYRGGEKVDKKNIGTFEESNKILRRQADFFRIVDTSNPRNKGKVCKNYPTDDIVSVLKYTDTKKKYTKYYKGKINKNEVCNIIKNLFDEQGMMFYSL